ncbi:aspartate-semialdehyde dehydrogenase [Tissierella creatinini]|nr:aspartate-semialdehyde dehydrogenase [Tissierella creatinini]TJX64618.1 aspartate-semialdehyde dehydrogenase [Soehngenia saccharolytica]
MKKYNVAVAGATGLVGSTILKVLEERNFPIENIYFLSSKKSAGSKITFKGNEYTVEELTEKSFDKDIDIALFAAGGSVSEKYAPIAVEKGVKVVDNSSVFRMNKDVPLVVPEINPEDIKWSKGLIANPNCSTIQSVVPLKPLHDKFKIKRVVYSTYQSVSGSGLNGLRDLEEGKVAFYPHQIQHNALPHIDSFLENGYTKEETKMIEETKKILHDDSIKVTATTVRIPVKFAHSVSINVEFEKPFEMEDVFKALKEFPGLVVQDDVKSNLYPMAINAEGKNEVFVGRIRRDFSVENGINLWCVADNIRKGAATNAVQIAELVAKSL